MRHDFARYGSLWIAVAKHRYFDFARLNRLFDENLLGEFGALIERGGQFRRCGHARHSYGRPERRWLYENREAESRPHPPDYFIALMLPIRARHREKRHDR